MKAVHVFKQWLAPMLVVIATMIPYAASLHNSFVGWDDPMLIINNPIIKAFTLSTITQAFTSFDPELYVPLTTITYQINHLIAGLNPFVYHLTNLILHIGNALLVLWIARLLNLNRWAALFIALIFAVHPINVEAVVWASARKDVLSAFFLLSSIGAYLRYTNEGSKRWYAATIILCLLGLLSKITVMMLPALLLLIDWYLDRPISKQSIAEKIPHAILSAIFIVVALFGKSDTGTLFVWEKFLMGAKATMFYLMKFFVPHGLSVVYPYTELVSIFTADLLLSMLGIITLTSLSIGALLKWKIKAPLFAWAWYILLLLPTFNNAAKGKNELLDLYFASDRYAYAALVGLLILIGLGIERGLRRWPTPTVSITSFALIIFSIVTYNQSMTWKNTMTIFTHAAEFYPNSYIAHSNIGTELYNAGDIDGALAAYRKALEIRDDSVTWYNVGQIFLVQGDRTKASVAYRNAITSSPLRVEAYIQLAKILIAQGATEEARQLLLEANENTPGNAEVEGMLDIIR